MNMAPGPLTCYRRPRSRSAGCWARCGGGRLGRRTGAWSGRPPRATCGSSRRRPSTTPACCRTARSHSLPSVHDPV